MPHQASSAPGGVTTEVQLEKLDYTQGEVVR